MLPKPLETIVRLVELDRIVCRESLELLLLLLLWHLSWLILIRLLPVLLLSATARIKPWRVFKELLPDGSASETIAKDASADALKGVGRVIDGVLGHIDHMAVVAIE